MVVNLGLVLRFEVSRKVVGCDGAFAEANNVDSFRNHGSREKVKRTFKTTVKKDHYLSIIITY